MCLHKNINACCLCVGEEKKGNLLFANVVVPSVLLVSVCQQPLFSFCTLYRPKVDISFEFLGAPRDDARCRRETLHHHRCQIRHQVMGPEREGRDHPRHCCTRLTTSRRLHPLNVMIIIKNKTVELNNFNQIKDYRSEDYGPNKNFTGFIVIGNQTRVQMLQTL